MADAPTAPARRMPSPGSVDLLQDGNALIPKTRIPVAGSHPYWEFAFGVGRTWQEPGEGEWMRAALPFSLMEVNANCLHHGVLTFVFAPAGRISHVAYQVSSETCAYFKADLWGFLQAELLDVTLPGCRPCGRGAPHGNWRSPAATSAHATGGRLSGIHSSRVRPSHGGDAVADVDLGRDRRRSPLQRRLSHTRGRISILRRAGAAVVFGRQVGVRQPRVDAARAAFPRCARAEGRGLRSRVCRARRLERSHVREPARHVERSLDLGRSACGRRFSGHVEGVFRRTSPCRKDRLRLWPFSQARDGGSDIRVSHQRYVRAGYGACGFRATENRAAGGPARRRRLAGRLARRRTQPVAHFSRRTRDDARQPFVGYGLALLPDDVAKLGQWLNPQGESARDLLDERMWRSALQLDAADRGLATTADGTLLYNDGFWAARIDDLKGCDVPAFVPFMSGFGGISIVLLPNGVTYYYFSDGNEFRFRRAIYAAARLRPYCRTATATPADTCQGFCLMTTSTPDAGTAAHTILGLRKAAPDGEVARVLLAFLATAGIFYVNIMPALVDGLVQGAGFSNRQAGLVGSSNVYGAAIGALIAVFIVKKIQWRTWAYALLAALIVARPAVDAGPSVRTADGNAVPARDDGRHARGHWFRGHVAHGAGRPYVRLPAGGAVRTWRSRPRRASAPGSDVRHQRVVRRTDTVQPRHARDGAVPHRLPCQCRAGGPGSVRARVSGADRCC